MTRRTFAEILVDELRQFPRSQASVAKLARGLGWTETKVERVVNAALHEASLPIYRGPGGVIRFRGSERGADVGIYFDVKRVIEDHWATKERLRQPRVQITASGGRRGERAAGVWSQPDLVLSALPPRRQQRTDPPDLHSIEVEIYTGFDIRSVYQAHAQGRGSTYSWVFFASSQQTSPHYDRIEWAAEQLGIGLVQFQRSGASGTYKTRLKATKRSSTPDERLIFCENTGFIDSVRTP